MHAEGNKTHAVSTISSVKTKLPHTFDGHRVILAILPNMDDSNHNATKLHENTTSLGFPKTDTAIVAEMIGGNRIRIAKKTTSNVYLDDESTDGPRSAKAKLRKSRQHGVSLRQNAITRPPTCQCYQTLTGAT